MKTPTTLLALLALTVTGCPSPVAYVTRHALEVAKPAPPPEAALIEAWTEELLTLWAVSPCAAVKSLDARAGMRRTFDQGLPLRLYWKVPPKCTGRLLQAQERTSFQHELAHALIDGFRLATWGDDPHHELMCQCALPISQTVCKALGL